MKYFSWKLDWSSGEGIDPVSLINNENTRVEPIFATGNLNDSNTLIYAKLVHGEIDISGLEKWEISEVSSEQILEIAKNIDEGASMEDGEIIFSPLPNLIR